MKDVNNNLLIARSDIDICINPRMANRHGLIAGATGTGKTVSLQVLAESFSSIGVPVFMTDIKGDLSGIAKKGGENPKVSQRLEDMKLEGFEFKSFPVCFWDVYGEQGHPLRTTVSEIGPLLLSRLLNLNDVQNGVLTIVYKVADENNLLLLDLKDLRKMLEYIGENREKFTTKYGNISTASIGAIQRNLLALEEQGADRFFGEPSLNIMDFMQTDRGAGVVNILAADKIMMSPSVYSTMLLWLLSELFEELPEAGDLEKPRLVFFFDEAHLLFNDAPKILLEKIEQVVRLIRSRGVGIYFITQNPSDLPDSVSAQLGNRVQHALRAFTPKEQKAVKTAAQTFRSNPKYDVETVITELGVGEALISFLDEKGVPSMVERARMLPPQGKIGPITPDERKGLIGNSLVAGVYDKAIDRESAYEILQEKMDRLEAEEKRTEEEKLRIKEQKSKPKTAAANIFSDFAKYAGRNVSRQIGNELGRQIIRGVLGGLFGGKSGKR